MADDKIRYVLDVDDKGTPKLVKFGTAAEKSSKQAAKGFAQAGKAISEAGSQIPGVGMAMDVMSKGPLIGASVAAASLAVGFGVMVSKSIDMADSMNDLSLRLGISTERLSVLSLYAEQSGTDIDTLASAMGKLGVKVASGDKDLKSYGVTAGSADEALFQLADKIAATEDPMLRLKIATDAFGKSGQQMLPLLVQGGDALREMGANAPIVSTEMAKMADEFNDKMAEFKGQWTSVSLSITSEVLPALTSVLSVVSDITTEMRKFGGVGAIAKTALGAVTTNPALIAKGLYGIATRDTRTDTEKAIGAMSGQSGVYRGEPLVAAPAKTYDSPDEIKARADAKEKVVKDFAAKQKKIEEDRVADAFRLNDLEIKTKWDAQVEYEKSAEMAEEERAEKAIALNEKELAAKASLRDKYEAEQTAKKKAALDAQFAMQMQFAGQMESVMSNAFYNTLRNGDNLWEGLAEGFSNMLAQMAAQMAARAAIFGLFNLFTGGTFGASAGGLSSFVFRAGGGPYESGSNLVTNERRPEAIIPRGPGRVAPTSHGGDTITIVVQNPTQAVSVRRQLTKSDRRRDTGIR